MKRLYDSHGYGDAPVVDCYWDTTVTRPPRDLGLQGDARADVAILGAGYTGLSAALHLARDAGADVAVVEGEGIGWGASGRNGGFVCIGGAKADEATLVRRFGKAALAEWQGAQRAAIELVGDCLQRYGIDADVHSREGEVVLAHNPRAFAQLRAEAESLRRDPAALVELIGPSELAGAGLSAAGLHGGLRVPVGFAINPLKYALGLARAAQEAGARVFENSPITRISREADGYLLHAPNGTLRARKLIIATNGYSSEDVPDWMAGRYLPAQSAVLVTRELTEGEIAAQGWSSDLMAYDTRYLLHYFRLMPNRRFLFGARGGTRADAEAQDGAYRTLRADFERMFPAWCDVETPHHWSGFACLSRTLTPYVGPVGDWPNAWAGFAWHGNGVAMGSYAGRLLAGLATGERCVPRVMADEPRRFPFGLNRRLLLPAAYAWRGLIDRF